MKFRIILFCLLLPLFAAAQTSWKGTTSTDWSNVGNWTGGVPTASVDAIIGDANFTGANQPALTGASFCKSLTIGTGAKASTLTQGSQNLTVSGGITIGANGTVTRSGGTLQLTGDLDNSGSYSDSSGTTIFAGTSQSLNGSTAFRKVTVNAGATVTQQGGTLTIHDLIITAGGTLAQQGGLLQFSHDWKNSGSFNSTGGTVQFTASAGAGGTFAGSTLNQFFHLVVNSGVNPGLFADPNSAVSIAGSYTNNNSGLSGSANTTFTFNGTGAQTVFSAATGNTFGHVVIDKPAGTLSLASDITVAGDWTNLQGVFSGGANTVTLASASASINGPTTTAFPNLTISSGANYTLNVDASCTGLILTGGGAISSLNHAGAVNLTVNGNVTINQPTASSITHTWNINAGSGTVSGTVTMGGANTTTSRIARINVTSGSLVLQGTLSYVVNSATVTAVVTVDTGTITLNSPLNLNAGQLNVTGNGGLIALNGHVGTGVGVLGAAAGSTVRFAGNYTNTSAAVTWAAGSLARFVSNSIVIPTAAITFDGIRLSAGATVTLAGAIAVKGDWTNNASVFDSGTNTVTFNGTTAQNLAGTATTTFGGLTLNNAAGAVLATNVTVNGALTLTAGKITTGSNNIRLGPSGSTASFSTSKYVVGNFEKFIAASATAALFEVGSASSYAPVNLALNGVTTGGYLLGNTTDGDHPNIGSSGLSAALSVNRYWTLTNNGIVLTSFNPTFTYVAADLDAGVLTAFVEVRRFSGGWTAPTPGTRTSTNAEATGVTAFGDFQLGEFRPVPTLASITPDFGTPGQTVVVTATGTGFLSGPSSVSVGAGITINSVVVNSATQLVANITVSPSATIGTRSFTVSNASPGGGTSGAQVFTVDQSTRWKGTLSTSWLNAMNWTAGVPNSTTPAVIGDVNFTGAFQPTLDGAATCQSLTLGAGTKASTLTQGSQNLTVSGGIIIGANGTTTRSGGTLNFTGNFENSGSYSDTAGTTIFAGTSQSLNLIGTTTFRNVTLRAGNTLTQTNGTFTIYDFTIASGGMMQQQGGVLQMSHDWRNSGTFNSTAGTVQFTASGGGGSTFTASNQFFNILVNSGVDPKFSAVANSRISVAGNYTNNNAALVVGVNATFTFNGSGTQTIFTAATGSTFGHFVLGKPSGTLVLASNIQIPGSWTNNGGTLDGGANTITFTGLLQSIGGTVSTTFPQIVIASAATYTMNNDNSCVGLTLAASANASSFTHNGNATLTAGNVTVAQPTASTVTAWNINAGTATVTGTLAVGGTSTSSGRVAKVVVTSGSLTANAVTFAANTVGVTEVITVATGTITINSALVLSSGQLNATDAGTITFSRDFTLGAGTLGSAAGASFRFGGNFANANAAYVFNAGATAEFLTNSVVTPTAAITFGNLKINSGATVTLGGSITVAGNWVNDGGTLVGGSNTVNFGGASKTISGAGSTDFPVLAVTTGTITMNSDNSCSTFSITNINAVNSFTHGGTANLTVTGNATVQQALGTLVHAWNINAGSATVTSNLTLSVTANNNGRVAKVVLTSGTLNVLGNLVHSNASLAANSVIDMSGGNGFLNLAGSFTISSLGTLTAGTNSIFNFNGTNAQTIPIGVSAVVYNNLRVNNSAGATLSAAITTANVTGNLRVLSGTLNSGGFAIVGNSSKLLEVADDATLRLTSTNGMPTGFGTRTLGAVSLVDYAGTNQTVVNEAYGHLSLSGSGTKTMPSGTLNIAGNFSMSGTPSATALGPLVIAGHVTLGIGSTLAGGSFAHSVAGNWTNNGTFTGNTSTVTLSGTAANLAGTGTNAFNNLTMAGDGIVAATNVTLTLAGNLATTGSGTFTHLSGGGGTLTMTGASKTISGSGISLNNFAAYGSVSSAASFTVTGNIEVTNSFSANAGTITMSGASKVIRGGGSIAFNALNISDSVSSTNSFSIASDLSVAGTLAATAGTVTFNGTSAVSGSPNLFNVTLNGTRLQLGSSAVLGIAGAFTLTTGTFDVTTTTPNTVNYNAAGAQTVAATTYDELRFSGGGTKTAGGAVVVNGDLNISSGATFAAGSFTHSFYGHWINNGAFTAGSSTVQLLGGSDSYIAGATTFNVLTLNKASASGIVMLSNNVSVVTINLTNGEFHTGTKVLTITTTRTGNGIILGTITRTHAFTTGTAYAFESPVNTVNFASATGVSSVTVTVAVGAVNDFPFGGSINRQYTLGVTASGAYSSTLRLHYANSELNGNTESALQLWRYGSSWTPQGKSGNDTVTNWVEQGSITNLAGRWTLSDDSSVVRWNGSVSTAWENPSNWTAVQGIPSLPPSSNEVVELGTITATYQPSITATATVKSITFGSAQAMTLTLGSGGVLTTVGNISGTWSNNVTHAIAVGSQTLAVGGDLTLSDGTNAHAINLSIGSGSVSVGSLTESGGANITFSGAGTLAIAGDFNYVSGTFTGGSGTVRYSGDAAQVVAAVTYNHLSVAKPSGTATLSASATINGNLTLTNGGTFQLSAPVTVLGDLNSYPGTTLNGGPATFSVGGNWMKDGTFTPGTGTVLLNGTNGQTIAASTFNNLSVNKAAGSATLTGNLSINGNLTLTNGTLDLSTFTANRSAVGGTLTVAAGTFLKIGGSFPSNYSTRTISTNSTVEYTGSAAQTVSAQTYGHLSFSNGGANAKTLAGATTVAGNLTINSNATFNGGSFSLTAQGSWTNSGTFAASTGTVTLSGSGKTLSGPTTFNILTVGGSYTGASGITVDGLMTVNPGASYAAGSTTNTLSGNLVNNGTFTSGGVVTFTGAGAQNVAFNSGFTSTGTINFNGTVAPTFSGVTSPAFQNVNVNNTGGVAPAAGWTVNSDFSVGSGSRFTGGSATHSFKKNFTNNGIVTSTGTLQFQPTNGVTLTLLGTGFTNSGTVIFGGTGQITLAGAAPSLKSVTIANTHASGVTPAAGWTLTGDLNVNSGATFHGGSGLTHAISGNISVNGTLSGGTSSVILGGTTDIGGSGTISFNHLTIGGTVRALAGVGLTGSLTNNGTLDALGSALTFSGSAAAVIAGTTTPTTIDSLVIAKSAATVTLAVNLSALTTLTISSGTLDNGAFTISQDAAGGTLTIGTSGTLKLVGTSSLPTFNTYSFAAAGIVEFAGSGTQTISAQNYGSLKSSSSGARILASSGVIGVSGTFTPAANSYTITDSTIEFNGSTSQTIPAFNYNDLASSSSGSRVLASSGTIGVLGTFTPGGNAFTVAGSTMSFNGAAQTIPASTYGNLTTAGSGAKTLGGNITVAGNLNLTVGTLADAGFTATVNGNLSSSVTHSGAGKILLIGGSTNHMVSGGGGWQNLEVADPNGALLNGTNLTVNGTLTLSEGRLMTSTNKVIVGTNGSVSRVDGYVAGWLQKPIATGSPTVSFEIGGSLRYAPVQLVFSNVTVAAAVLAQTVGTDHPDIARAPVHANKSVNRYWSLTNLSGTFGSYTATFEFDEADLDVGANPTNLLAANLIGTNWTVVPVLARSATNLQTASLASFGEFQLGGNAPPVAGADVVTRPAGSSGFKVLLTDLLANDSDITGDPLSIIAVTNLSVQGAAVERFGSWIFYTPSGAIDVNDQFTYTLSDGQGETAIGIVSVNIQAVTQSRQLSSVAAGSGSFYGVLNTGYTVQYVDDLGSTNWLTLTNLTTSTNGLGQFTDPGPLPPQRYYRIVYP